MKNEPDFAAVIASFNEWACSYTEEQLRDYEWLVDEIARKGYGINVTHETVDSYLAMVEKIGQRAQDDPDVIAMTEKMRETGGFYIYQLKGPNPLARDGHSCPLLVSLHQALLVALSNVCRLQWQAIAKNT